MDINMTTESSDEEAEGQVVGVISKHLIVDSDLRDLTKNATWSASSSKP
ncbi:hypothetical protein KSS87_009282, partial [Heliosperma pusillum]